MKPTMNTLVWVAVGGIAGYGLYYIFKNYSKIPKQSQEKKRSTSEVTSYQPSHEDISPQSDQTVRELILKYLDGLRDDVKEFELKTYYSYQFGLPGKQGHATRKISTIANLSEIGMTPRQVAAGNRELIALAQEITHGDPSDWGMSLSLLIEYYVIDGKIEAIRSIYNEVSDKILADQLFSELERHKKNLTTGP